MKWVIPLCFIIALSGCHSATNVSNSRNYTTKHVVVEQGFAGMIPFDDLQEHLSRVGLLVPSGPAERGGMRVGDLVLKVNGVDAHKLKRKDWLKIILGPVGEHESFSIQRGAGDPFTILVVLGTQSKYDQQVHQAAVSLRRKADRTISCSRISNSPYKFVGKLVEFKGIVTAPIPDQFSVDCDDGDSNTRGISVYSEMARTLEQGSMVDVIAVISSPVYGDSDSSNGVSTGQKALFTTAVAFDINGKPDSDGVK